MIIFRVGEKVQIKSSLVCSANKHWIGKIGVVLKAVGINQYLVKWEHLEKPMEQCGDYIELAPRYYGH